jgi:hypothetical protein
MMIKALIVEQLEADGLLRTMRMPPLPGKMSPLSIANPGA